MKTYLKLFSCCLPVKGHLLSIICDLQRNSFHYIPNELYELLIKGEIHIESLLISYDNSERETLREYFDFLVDEEYAMLTDSPNSFPPIDTKYSVPEKINNAIIDFDNQSKHDMEKISASLEILGCKHLELRFFSDYSLNFISTEILPYFRESKIRSILLYVKYKPEFSKESLYQKITQQYPRVLSMIVHSSPSNEFHENINYRNIIYSKNKITSEKHCGLVGLDFFSIDYSTFFESLNYNTCLNKKVSIDVNGLIKNCPSQEKNYGSHISMKIEKVVSREDFQSLWNIKKDDVKVCKDCQFRHICTDCRIYLENPKDIYSKPLKCGYNPYTNEWQEWSKLAHKQHAIKEYNLYAEK